MSNLDNKSNQPDISSLRIAPQDKQGSGKSKIRFLLLPVFLTLAAVGWGVYSWNSIPKVTVVVAEQTRIGNERTILNASGYVTPRRKATIAAEITGRLVAVLVDEGMHVQTGDVLARFDDTDFVAGIKTLEAEVAAAEASIVEINVNLENARRNLTRDRRLLRTEVISRKELEDAETQVGSLEAKRLYATRQLEVSKARLAEMKKELGNYTITAPFSGIVVSKDAQVGEIVSPVSAGGGFTRTGIATIVDMASLEIEVDINESFIAKVKSGQTVTAVLDAYPDWPIPATVSTVIPTADRQKATVKVRIAFDKLDPRILPDMGVKVAFLESAVETAGNGETNGNGRTGVRIPLEAVRKEGDRSIVFIHKDGKVESRAVKTGAVEGKFIDIVAGILPGETVVVGGVAGLSDGNKVRLSSS